MSDAPLRGFVIAVAVIINALFGIVFNIFAREGMLTAEEVSGMSAVFGMFTLFIFAFAANTVFEIAVGDSSEDYDALKTRVSTAIVIVFFTASGGAMAYSGTVPTEHLLYMANFGFLAGVFASLPFLFHTPEGRRAVSWIEQKAEGRGDAV